MGKVLGKKSSIQRKIVLVYIFIAVLPISIVTFASSVIYYNNILKKFYNLLEQNARQHEIVVNERMYAYESVLYELVTNKEYIDLAKKINIGDENSLLIDKDHMEKLLRSCVYTYDRIRSVTFLADSSAYVTYSKWYDGSAKIIWKEASVREEIHDEIENAQSLTYIATVNLSNMAGTDDYVILIGYPVKNLKTKQQSGVLVMALEEEVLLFNDIDAENENDGITTVLLDTDDKIVAGVESTFINDSYANYLNKKFGDGKVVSEKRHAIEGTKWTIVNIIDTAVYKQEIYHFIKVVFALMVTITCFFFVVVFLITRKYIETIQHIAQGIRNYEGTDAKPIKLKVDEQDELYVIVRQFNKMTNRVNSLVVTLQQRNEEVKAAAISQKHAEIKALEAQINPHFLFNTLDSINWRAIEHEEEDISDMLGTLGSLLRYSISNIDMEVLLEAEINWLKKYIFLQRDRFGNSFDCRYDITEEAFLFPIYKMLLQPIIENTILHAFEDVKKGGMIYVKAFVREDGKLKLQIRDNGCGMTEALLEEINEEIRVRGPLNSKKIGISNVIHRLRIYYHEAAEISVNSKLGEGTEFVLIIPVKQ